MEAFHWAKNFETGINKIDGQHQALVEIINRLGNCLTDDYISLNDLSGVFEELAAYAQYHFSEEEALMKENRIDCRHLDNHIEIHRGFIAEVSSQHSSISEDNTESAKHLLDFLVQWLTYHILGSDHNLARQIASIQSGMDPAVAYETEERERDVAMEPLLRALHNLFDQVSARNKDLVRLNQSLEEKVAQRTEELTAANLHLEELSLTDVLTGLPNRRHAMRRLSFLWDEALASGQQLSCIMIDADHFKEVNDNYGHDAGDVVLQMLSRSLQHAFRSDDIVCRLSGDEFFVIVPKTDSYGAMQIAEQARETVAKLRVPTVGEPWHGSISLGVATRTDEMKSFEELIKAADEAIYVAKDDGKNCVRLAAANKG